MVNSHPKSIISSKAKIGENVTIGPYCVINDDVTIGNNVELKAHVYLDEGSREYREKMSTLCISTIWISSIQPL